MCLRILGFSPDKLRIVFVVVVVVFIICGDVIAVLVIDEIGVGIDVIGDILYVVFDEKSKVYAYINASTTHESDTL